MDYLDNLMYSEEWEYIDGYEEYMVSSYGRVASLKKYGKKEFRILKPYKDKRRGYLHVCLRNKNGQKLFMVHRLVAKAFINNINNLPQVNHKDEDKENNKIDNLEWCDNEYNINYGTRKRKISEKYGKKILQYDKNMNFIKEWNGTCSASRSLKINEGNIWENCNNKRKTAGGYIWKYRSEVYGI